MKTGKGLSSNGYLSLQAGSFPKQNNTMLQKISFHTRSGQQLLNAKRFSYSININITSSKIMKNILTAIVLYLLITLSANHASAQNTATAKTADLIASNSAGSLLVNVFQMNEDKFAIKVHFENYAKGGVTVRLKASGSVLHKEVVETATYARKYDMLNLPVGDYKIEVENSNKVYTRKITIRIENGRRVLNLM
jgi:hypothetical protein